MENNENFKICSTCNGKCCKSHPCAVFPEDIKPLSKEKIREMINSNYCINWWEGDVIEEGNLSRVYYIMPRVKGDNRVIVNSWGGECTFFVNNKGCSLSWQDRPTGGKLLIPGVGSCTILGGKSDKFLACMAWRRDEYQELLTSLTYE